MYAPRSSGLLLQLYSLWFSTDSGIVQYCTVETMMFLSIVVRYQRLPGISAWWPIAITAIRYWRYVLSATSYTLYSLSFALFFLSRIILIILISVLGSFTFNQYIFNQSINAPTVWNFLNSCTVDSGSLAVFKSRLKTFLFRRTFNPV